MTTLTAKQRMKLKGLAHSLKPILYIGKEGVTESMVRAVENAFNTREILKVKVQDGAPESADESGEILANRVKGAHLVQVIGRTVVLYRPHPDAPKIELPHSKSQPEDS
ncbi:MAG TPA: ribosome assembly RNA-binding protein YhbY [Blastocatellia bacterium]